MLSQLTPWKHLRHHDEMYDFGDFGVLWDHTNIPGAQYKRRGHGVAFVGEYGTLIVDRAGW